MRGEAGARGRWTEGRWPVDVLPVGGLGEIGMNCCLVGARGRVVMVDCGVQFPKAWEVGVERRLPDLRWLQTSGWGERVEAVVLTHGHEDHIGALPWVLPVLDRLRGERVPVWASGFTRELVRRRLEEHALWDPDRVRRFEVSPAGTPRGERACFVAGPWEIEPVRVTHSLPDCASLVLRSEDATVVHTGDWKIDRDPMDGEGFDLETFERVGREGVTLLLSDSTNAMVPGWTVGEREVQEGLAKQIEAWPGRVVVTQFASNLHRLRGLAEIAEATGRRIGFAGTSLWKYLQAAEVDGRAPLASSKVVDLKRGFRCPPHEQIIVTTGSQGERISALTRAARGEHRWLDVGRGDLVLHSARVIPGNEARVYEMFNALARRGADLVYGRSSGIHASGHARREELKTLVEVLRPALFVPVHGEYTFLRRHAELMGELEGGGGPRVEVVQNGERLSLGAGSSHDALGGCERTSMALLDVLYNAGPTTGDAAEMALSERMRIAWNGVVAVDVQLAAGPPRWRAAEARAQGRGLYTGDDTLWHELARVAKASVDGLPTGTPASEVEEAVRGGVRAACRRLLGRKPDVLVVLHHGRAGDEPLAGAA